MYCCRVGEVADAAVADVLEKRRFVEEAEDERRVLHGEATEHEAVGLEHNHGGPPPEDRNPAPDYKSISEPGANGVNRRELRG